jgi:hypothetical protein
MSWLFQIISYLLTREKRRKRGKKKEREEGKEREKFFCFFV